MAPLFQRPEESWSQLLPGRKRPVKPELVVQRYTVGHLVDWLVSLNARDLFDFKHPASRYEIERGVVWIMQEHLGIPVMEIELVHSFTDDLGID